MTDNTLYYGDNLAILREHIPDESVDLIYLDPPFNSNASYNVLFKERSGEESAAQIQAFEDTWHWGGEAERAFADMLASPLASQKSKDLLVALRKALGDATRVRILLALADGELCVGDLVAILRVRQPTASQHLAHLRRAGLVVTRRYGAWSFYALTPARGGLHGKLVECVATCSRELNVATGDAMRARKLRKTGGCCPRGLVAAGRS